MCVTTIIPAYNEEKYIGAVLTVLRKIEEITQIIVVSDGSTDNTVQEALRQNVQVIALPKNIGKGGALTRGLQSCLGKIVLFLDADLIGLTEEHVFSLIKPLLTAQTEMTVGVFEKGRLMTDVAQVFYPYLSGQRCLRKKHLVRIKNLAESGFGAETVLTDYALQNNLSTTYVQLANLSHVLKEEKFGLVKGMASRLRMYWEIAKNVHLGG